MEKKYSTLMNGLTQQVKQLLEELDFDLKNRDCKQIEKDIEYLKFYLNLMKKVNISYGMKTVKDMSFSIKIDKNLENENIIKELTKELNKRSKSLLLLFNSLIISITALIIIIF